MGGRLAEGLLGLAGQARTSLRENHWKRLKTSRIAQAVLIVPLVGVLASCSLNGQMNVSADGQAQISLSAVVERSLADSDQACQSALQSIFTDFLQIKDAQITSSSDTENLTCEASVNVNLNELGWDGHDGRPLWQAGPASYEPESGASVAEAKSGPKTMSIRSSQHRLFLPLSQGSQGLGVTDAILAELSGQIKPTLTITMPEAVTSASSGKIEGNTVTLNGVSAFVKDLDIVTGGNRWEALSGSTRLAVIAGGVVVVLAVLLFVVARRRKKKRERSSQAQES